jgi:hypothetical protein
MEVIAYYLPQFYPFKENDEWWGEGFTEWTNVGKAKPLFKNHYQPKIPSNLGYYDLRISEIREKQVELAKEAGVTGFCYWHYWFGNGKRLLDMPFNEVLNSGKPDFPFCLGWANETWKAKVWNSLDSPLDKTLIEQVYPGKNDIESHFLEVLPAFRDNRYIKIDNRPVFVIYKPLNLPDCKEFLSFWNSLAKKSGLVNGIFFIGHTVNDNEKNKILDLGFDAVNIVRTGEHRFNRNVIKKIPLKLILFRFFKRPLILNYSFISRYFIKEMDKESNIFPTLIPNWDHTPRSGKYGVIFHNANPKEFKKHAIHAFEAIKNKEENRQIIFLKSWNEWGEGNYMEPDLKYGKGMINTLKEVSSRYLK